MTTFVALLRGINVGGNRRLPMTDVRHWVTEVGVTEVVTYIQSGNVVLRHPGRSADTLRDDLERRLAAATGWDIAVVVRTAAEWAALVAVNPFPDADPSTLHVACYRDRPAAGSLDSLDLVAHAPETCALVGAQLYLHLPNGMGRATLPGALSKLRPAPGAAPLVMTMRNWRTITALRELSGGG
jgi:uncharacterized protein (DUF1697 family)